MLCRRVLPIFIRGGDAERHGQVRAVQGLSGPAALSALANSLETRFGLNPKKTKLDHYQRERAAVRAAALVEALAACPPGWVLRDSPMDRPASTHTSLRQPSWGQWPSGLALIGGRTPVISGSS